MTVLKWPGNSPDLNPIENLWGFLKQSYLQLGLSSKHEVIRWFLNCAHRSEEVKKMCEKLVDSMPGRVEKLITARGGHINY